jgi:hypothetical protein
MVCKECGYPIKSLTRFRSRFKVFCLGHSDYPNIYHFERIKIGEIVIYSWNSQHKCYNLLDSRRLRDSIRGYMKKHGGQFYVRRHLAGIEVTRLL